MTDKNFIRTLLKLSVLIVLCNECSSMANDTCIYKGKEYKDGETWVARSTFVLRCDITKNGWKTKVVGCRTAEGVVVMPGQTVFEGNTNYECLKQSDGTVEIKRTLNTNRKKSCGDHSLGESWIFEKSFMARCTENGVQITDCISESGIPVPLNGSLVLSGVKYDCITEPTGKISLKRDASAQQIGAVRPTTLSPLEILGPMFKRFGGDLDEALENDNDKVEVNASSQMVEATETTCDFEGENRKAGEVWVADNIFTKKCTDTGATVILNCVIDDKRIINVDTELKVGRKTYKCYRKKNENRVYYEVRIN